MGRQATGATARSFYKSILLLLSIPTARGLPIPRNLTPTVDPGPDAWAEGLSGIGPLILLIGDRNTKQVLREIRGIHNAFSLAVAPLGLIFVLTGLIRLCGDQRLRSFIGYELEARASAGIEMTRINCGSVHAELVDGYIVRSTTADPQSQAIAVSTFEGDSEGSIDEAIARIRECNNFKSKKAQKSIPDGVANTNWCLRVTCSKATKQDSMEDRNEIKDMSAVEDCSGLEDILSDHLTNVEDRQTQSTMPKLQISFLCTFEAVSEFAVSAPLSKAPAIIFCIVSLVAILTMQVAALWQQNWRSAGWLLMFSGYIGIVLGTLSAAMLIHSSCACLVLHNRNTSYNPKWTEGLVISVKNTDSMDTTGSNFYRCSTQTQTFEAVWMKDPNSMKQFLAWVVSIFLSLAFICHYLGLRSCRWWLSVSELVICISAAFIRSITRGHQHKFEVFEDIKIDKRCMSTGIIRTQAAMKIDSSLLRGDCMDLRIYSDQPSCCTPLAGEQIAWQAAKLCHQSNDITSRLLDLTGMRVMASTNSQQKGNRAIFASFNGGLIVTEGLAFPGTRICLGFSSSITDLAAPTPLLSRGIMRQPQWAVTHSDLGKDSIPLGQVYISQLSSIIDWWTLSEDRNDRGDLQKNLQWCMFFVNMSFFLALMDTGLYDVELIIGIEKMQQVASEENVKIAGDVFKFFKDLWV
ncbi:hypothetical protein AOQ84DRAFT_404329 [Glonium stellatum]|uniref:Uncharacterized protein n=1 Tax=Glonium stellatum TaxID=574774 RepID=A0A8E2F2Z5_9PEZI|nr:hypothetical protein AOQ84DRAFT_404329 [Glonium stellatum]